jgi:hypothetical protein
MPLWLDLLRTPMAAPETKALRRLRFTWLALCSLSASVAAFFKPLHHDLGWLAPIVAAPLLLATFLVTWLYLARKRAADDAWLAQAGEGE